MLVLQNEDSKIPTSRMPSRYGSSSGYLRRKGLATCACTLPGTLWLAFAAHPDSPSLPLPHLTGKFGTKNWRVAIRTMAHSRSSTKEAMLEAAVKGDSEGLAKLLKTPHADIEARDDWVFP